MPPLETLVWHLKGTEFFLLWCLCRTGRAALLWSQEQQVLLNIAGLACRNSFPSLCSLSDQLLTSSGPARCLDLPEWGRWGGNMWLLWVARSGFYCLSVDWILLFNSFLLSFHFCDIVLSLVIHPPSLIIHPSLIHISMTSKSETGELIGMTPLRHFNQPVASRLQPVIILMFHAWRT